jgi:hypothetical protein
MLISALEENSFSENSLTQETWDSLAGKPPHVSAHSTVAAHVSLSRVVLVTETVTSQRECVFRPLWLLHLNLLTRTSDWTLERAPIDICLLPIYKQLRS